MLTGKTPDDRHSNPKNIEVNNNLDRCDIHGELRNNFHGGADEHKREDENEETKESLEADDDEKDGDEEDDDEDNETCFQNDSASDCGVSLDNFGDGHACLDYRDENNKRYRRFLFVEDEVNVADYCENDNSNCARNNRQTDRNANNVTVASLRGNATSIPRSNVTAPKAFPAITSPYPARVTKAQPLRVGSKYSLQSAYSTAAAAASAPSASAAASTEPIRIGSLIPKRAKTKTREALQKPAFLLPLLLPDEKNESNKCQSTRPPILLREFVHLYKSSSINTEDYIFLMQGYIIIKTAQSYTNAFLGRLSPSRGFGPLRIECLRRTKMAMRCMPMSSSTF